MPLIHISSNEKLRYVPVAFALITDTVIVIDRQNLFPLTTDALQLELICSCSR
jgi:hypothetical protein